MTLRAVRRAGLAHLIDARYAGRAVGVAGVSCRVLGRIPARTVSLVFGGCATAADGSENGCVVVDRSPSICVLEEGIGGNGDGVDLLLGLDALEDWSAGICLKDRTLTIRPRNVGRSTTVATTTTTKRGGSAYDEVDLVIPFVNSGASGKSEAITTTPLSTQPSTSIPKKKLSAHQHCRSIHTNNRNVAATNKRPNAPPSNSIPWTASNRKGMATTDLESDLDLLDSTNNGVWAYGMDKSSSEDGGYREEGDNDTWDDTWDDDDDEYFESDFDYDGCNLSGI